MHRLHGGKILPRDALNVASAFLHVTDNAAEDALVRVRLDVYLYVEHIAQALFAQHKYAFNDHNIRRFDQYGFVGAVMDREIVHGTLHRLSVLQRREMLNEQIRFERIRMIVVEVFAFLKRYVVAPAVIIVVIYDRNTVAEFSFESVRERGFSRARSSGDAYYHTAHVLSLPFVCYYSSDGGKSQ